MDKLTSLKSDGALTWKDIDKIMITETIIYEASGAISSGGGIATRFLNNGQTAIASGLTGVSNIVKSYLIDPAKYPSISGLTPKLQLKCMLYTNSTAPAVDYTVVLHTFSTSGTATQMICTTTGTFGNSAVFLVPAINSQLYQESTTFDLPLVATTYCIGVTNSNITNSYVAINSWLYLVYE